MSEPKIDLNAIINICGMYATVLSTSYRKLIADGFPKELAYEAALAITKEMIRHSFEMGARQNQSLQELMASMPIKGEAS